VQWWRSVHRLPLSLEIAKLKGRDWGVYRGITKFADWEGIISFNPIDGRTGGATLPLSFGCTDYYYYYQYLRDVLDWAIAMAMHEIPLFPDLSIPLFLLF
jgi:hypothetical protein